MADRQIYDRPLSERPRLVKLGVKPGQKISVLGIEEPGFVEELKGAGADVSLRLRRNADILFFAAERFSDLERIAQLRGYIVSNGAIWVIRRKGGGAPLKDIDVITAGLVAQMVDNKITAFSETHAAMRLVLRLVDR